MASEEPHVKADDEDVTSAPRKKFHRTEEEDYGYYFYPQRSGSEEVKSFWSTWFGRPGANNFRCEANVIWCMQNSEFLSLPLFPANAFLSKTCVCPCDCIFVWYHRAFAMIGPSSSIVCVCVCVCVSSSTICLICYFSSRSNGETHDTSTEITRMVIFVFSVCTANLA